VGRRGYPLEIRRRALDQVAAGRSVYQVSVDLGVSVQAIYAWRTQAAIAEQSADSPPERRVSP
jgi:transposase-like protein